MKTSGFAQALKRENEVQITFRKRNGEMRTIPIWFTVGGSKLELLPMYGSKSRWFQDVENIDGFEVSVTGLSIHVTPTIVRDLAAVDEVKKRFSSKYGKGEVDKYYPSLDVALEIPL